MDNSEFFDESMTRTIVLAPSGLSLTGYFDLVNIDMYMNDDVEAKRGTFVCETFASWETYAGQETTIDNFLYRVNKVSPDGTGITTLELLNI